MSQPFSNFFKENPNLFSQICYKIGCIISELFCSMRFSTSFINSSFDHQNQNQNQSSTTNSSFSTEQQNLNSHLFDPSQSTFELFGLDFLLCLDDENEIFQQKEEEKKSPENNSKSKPQQSPQLFNISPILLEVNPSPDIAQSGQSNFGMMLRLVNGILGFFSFSHFISKSLAISLFLSIVINFFLLSSFYSIL